MTYFLRADIRMLIAWRNEYCEVNRKGIRWREVRTPVDHRFRQEHSHSHNRNVIKS